MLMFEVPFRRSKERNEFRRRADEKLSVVAPECRSRWDTVFAVSGFTHRRSKQPTILTIRRAESERVTAASNSCEEKRLRTTSDEIRKMVLAEQIHLGRLGRFDLQRGRCWSLGVS